MQQIQKADWQSIILRDICEKVDYGYTASAKQEPIGPKFLRITDIVPELVDWDSVPHAEIEDDKVGKYLLKEGDIVIARTGATTGYAKRIRGNRQAVFASYLVRLRIKPEYDDRYIGCVVESDDYKRFIKANIGGAAQPNANAQVLTSYNLSLPPLPTQRKIAAILSAYDDLIENNTRRIAILEKLAQAIYREWFVHFRFPGHEGVRMVESELGLVPEGWEVVKLGDIAQEVRRSVQPDQVAPETRYVGLEHIPRKSIALTDWGSVDQVKSTKLIFKKGEILFGKIRPYFHKVVVAPFEGICSTDTIVILSKKAEHYYLVLSCVSNEHFVDYATQTSQGTKMPRADWKVLVKYPIALPPTTILNEFSEMMQDIVAQIHNLIIRNQNLRQTRDLLLPRLVSGELDVSGLEIEMGQWLGEPPPR